MTSKRTKPTPVIDAVLTRDGGLLESAIRAGGDVDERDRFGRTALHHATIQGDDQAVAILLQVRADVAARDRDDWTPLHFAAQGYRVAIVRRLIEAGAPVDTADAHGNTPLFRAVLDSCGRGEVIEQLLAAGADRHHRNRSGVSPVDLASTIANYDVKKWLERGA